MNYYALLRIAKDCYELMKIIKNYYGLLWVALIFFESEVGGMKNLYGSSVLGKSCSMFVSCVTCVRSCARVLLGASPCYGNVSSSDSSPLIHALEHFWDTRGTRNVYKTTKK